MVTFVSHCSQVRAATLPISELNVAAVGYKHVLLHHVVAAGQGLHMKPTEMSTSG